MLRAIQGIARTCEEFAEKHCSEHVRPMSCLDTVGQNGSALTAIRERNKLSTVLRERQEQVLSKDLGQLV